MAKIWRRNASLAVIFIIAISALSAREPFPLAIAYNPYRLARLADPESANDQKIKIGIKSYGLALRYPALLESSRLTIYNGLDLSYLHFSYRNWSLQERSYRPLDLYGMNYVLLMSQKLGKRWQADIAVMPGVFSDFKNFSGDVFLFQGRLALNYQVREGLAYGLGAAYQNIWGDPQLMPVIKLDWRLSSLYILDIDLPSCARLQYNFLDGLEFGLAGRLSGNYYHIGGKNFPGEDKGHHIKSSFGTAGFYMGIRIAGELFWTSEFGGTFRRRFESFNSERGALESLDLKNGFYFSTRLDLRPPIIY